MRSLALTAAVLAVAPATAAQAQVTGISDDNLPLMTQRGRAAIQQMPFHHARMVVSMGTPPNGPQVRAWMHEAAQHPWTVMISARRTADQPVPTPQAYSAWLRGFLRAYPSITAVEATNEPELSHLTPAQAAGLYRAARRAARGRNVRVLAGGVADNPAPRYTRYVRAYTRAVHAPRATWALHAYVGPMQGSLARQRWMLRTTHARHVWITETAAFVAHGTTRFSPASQRRQARLILRLSNWPRVDRAYWQGWEACNGCQPTISAPQHPAVAKPTQAGPVLPYHVAPSPIVWDSYLLSSGPNTTDTRQSAAILADDKG